MAARSATTWFCDQHLQPASANSCAHRHRRSATSAAKVLKGSPRRGESPSEQHRVNRKRLPSANPASQGAACSVSVVTPAQAPHRCPARPSHPSRPARGPLPTLAMHCRTAAYTAKYRSDRVPGSPILLVAVSYGPSCKRPYRITTCRGSRTRPVGGSQRFSPGVMT